MTWREQEDESDEGERDDPLESDMDSTDEPELIQCPHCAKYVNEEAQRCHHCGQFIEEGRSMPMWVIVAAIVLLIAFGISLYYCGVLI